MTDQTIQIISKEPQSSLVSTFPSRRRALSQQEAIEIFKYKKGRGERLSSLSAVLAQRYGVSSKCIRDIWQGRTWPEATFHLWNEGDQKSDEYNRKIEKVRHLFDFFPFKAQKQAFFENCCCVCVVLN